MNKDERYLELKKVIEAGIVEEFSDIFKYIPRTVIARDIGKNPSRAGHSFLESPERLTFENIFRLSQLTETSASKITDLIQVQYLKKIKGKKKIK